MSTATHRGCWWVAVSVTVVALAAHPPEQATGGQPQARFAAGTLAVRLSVGVTDASGHPVEGLARENFVVREDGIPRPLHLFEGPGRSPGSVVLVLDRSSSMSGEPLERAKRGVRRFLDHVSDGTEIALISFDETVSVDQEFTQRHEPVWARVEGLMSRGGTALYDAVLAALDLLASARFERQAVVVLSDGGDHDSQASLEQVEARILDGSAVIFALGYYREALRQRWLAEPERASRSAYSIDLSPPWILRRLTALSGGIVRFPRPTESLGPFFVAMAREARGRYLLGYLAVPAGEPRVRDLDVEVREVPHRDSLSVRARATVRY